MTMNSKEIDKQKNDETIRVSISSDNYESGEFTQSRSDSPDTSEMMKKTKAKGHVARWEEMFNRLIKFKKKHGHCLVPNRYAEDRKLGTWVATQRRQYKALMAGCNESTQMTDERAMRLREIGFDFSPKDPDYVSWESRFNQFVQFVNKHGHVSIPSTEMEGLSHWVATQRNEYKLLQKGLSSHLTPDRVDLLTKVGFHWEAETEPSLTQNVDNNTFTSTLPAAPLQQEIASAPAMSSPDIQQHLLAPGYAQNERMQRLLNRSGDSRSADIKNNNYDATSGVGALQSALGASQAGSVQLPSTADLIQQLRRNEADSTLYHPGLLSTLLRTNMPSASAGNHRMSQAMHSADFPSSYSIASAPTGSSINDSLFPNLFRQVPSTSDASRGSLTSMGMRDIHDILSQNNTRLLSTVPATPVSMTNNNHPNNDDLKRMKDAFLLNMARKRASEEDMNDALSRKKRFL